jgi:hypothetical protein
MSTLKISYKITVRLSVVHIKSEQIDNLSSLISQDVYTNIPKSKKQVEIWNASDAKHLG